MSVLKQDWVWFGHAGHFICADDCRFHLCTKVGDYLVSTVGEMMPDEGVREIHAEVRGLNLQGRGDDRKADYFRKNGWEEIGCGRTYETMVFKAGKTCDADGCNCGLPAINGSEIDFEPANDAKTATENHYALCNKYSELQP